MNEKYFLIFFVFVSYSALAQKPQKPPKVEAPPGGGAPPADVGQFSQLADYQKQKYQLGSKAMIFNAAFQACKTIKSPGGNASFHVFDLVDTSKDNPERLHIAKELEKNGADCVWVSTQIKNINGRKMSISESPKARRINLFDPSHFGAEAMANNTSPNSAQTLPAIAGAGAVAGAVAGTGGPPTPGKKKVKRQVQIKNGVKLITMVATQTLFPFVQNLKNETNDCYPACKPKECTVIRKQEECEVKTSQCNITAVPKCEIIKKGKDCTGGCDNCTMESVNCFVRTQTCMASRAPCKVQPPICTLAKATCTVVRPSCVTYSKPCNVTLPPNNECTAEAVCVNRTDSYCRVIVDPECEKLNDSSIKCARIFNCTLDPICIKPILCRPPAVRCPPLETFCPPPEVKCPPPTITCEKPILQCPEPLVICPAPDVVCTRPKVVCSAPVIRCSQVLSTCVSPEMTCPPPKISCPNPKIICTKDEEECPQPPLDIEICQPPKCEGDCQCVRLSKKYFYGLEPCSCSEQCNPLCEY